MRLIDRLRSEQGFTMLVAIGAMALVLTLSVVTFTAVNTQASATGDDSFQKEAYAAAQAGVQQYLYDLDSSNQYWSQCVPSTNPDGVNNTGSTTNRRTVPGSTVEQYAIELLPAAGQSTYTQCSTTSPAASMIQTTGTGAGSMRIRVTGYAGNETRTIVAQLSENSFLDNVWFTQYETDDPQVQLVADGCSPSSCPGTTSWSTALGAAQTQCSQYYRDGRANGTFWTSSSSASPANTSYGCDAPQFISSDNLKGPVYTDDEFFVCGSPTFGRTKADKVQIGASTIPTGATGTIGQTNEGASGCTASAVNNGTVKTGATVQTMPAGNTSLATAASSANGGLTLTGPSCITLNGTTNTILVKVPVSGGSCATATGGTTYNWPTNGTVFVQNNSASGYACTLAYNYTNPDYNVDSTDNGCGEAYVSGTYSQPLTIGAANDLVVTGDTTYTSATGNALLGLVALNGFIRVQHTCTQAAGNRTIDAAILSVQHSFIVDNYRCGSATGALNINGSIAQEFRGSVGTNSAGTLSSGYSKNYVYDDRLQYEEPPNFLDPKYTTWNVVRENECAAIGSNTCS